MDIRVPQREALRNGDEVKMKDQIMIIGAAILDVLVQPADREVFERGSCAAESITLHTGGDALNEATVLAKLGERPELVTVLGNDKAGKMIREHCADCGVGLHYASEENDIETGINVVLVDREGERHFLTNPHGTLRTLRRSHIPPSFPEQVKLLSFASIFVFPHLSGRDMEEIFAAAKAQGITVCADMTKIKTQESREGLAEALSFVDYLLPNYEEAALVTGKTELTEIADTLLGYGVKNVVIKCGKEGCFIKNSELCCRVPALPGIRAVDMTGAGDCFAAGFLYALSKGKEIRECAVYGNACGALAVQHHGASAGIRDARQVEAAAAAWHRTFPGGLSGTGPA